MPDVQEELEALMERVSKLDTERQFKSVVPLIREGLDRSREARDFDWYISFLFQQLRRCSTDEDPAGERDTAIEMISLLENEEAAKRIQPNLDAEAYEYARHWYSSCAYDRLAGATMNMQGCNSEGMYGAIEAGVEICHRTGKTGCIVCFRENGVDSSIAADDLEIALNQALWLAHRNQDNVQHDRRVLGWRRVALIKILEGDPRTALRALEPAWEVCDDYHDPDDAKRDCHNTFETACVLLGEPEAYEEWKKDHPRPDYAARGECTSDDAEQDRLAALRAAAGGDWAKVEELLTPWLEEYDRREHLRGWFQIARQLFASRMTAGDRTKADELGDEMLRRAGPAREWFVKRMVDVYRHEDFTPNPFGTAFPMLEGPWKDRHISDDKSAAEAPQPEESAQETPEDAPGEEQTEMQKQVDAWLQTLREAEDPQPVMEDIESKLLAIDPSAFDKPEDARPWLHAATWLAREGRAAADIWRAARQLQRRFSDDAFVLTYAADVGDLLRAAEGDVDVRPEPEELDAIYRKALALDPNNAQAHFSAGSFYEQAGNLSEAERCYARAFRLDRAASAPAMAAARIYRLTDRPRDGLEALDVAIRHGCHDPRLFWEATADAFELGLWERCLGYGKALADGVPDVGGVRYFMALSNLHLENWQEAIDLIDKEAEIEPAAKLQVHVVHARALAGLERNEDSAAAVREALALPLPEVDYMAPRGLVAMCSLLIETTRAIEDTELEKAVVARARRAGVLHNDYIEEDRLRDDNKEVDPVFLFEVFMKQPLSDDHAAHPDTPYWEKEWGSYLVRWLVLAENEEQAAEYARAQQSQAGDQPAEIESVNQQDGEYAGKPGVVEEGIRDGTPRAS